MKAGRRKSSQKHPRDVRKMSLIFINMTYLLLNQPHSLELRFTKVLLISQRQS